MYYLYFTLAALLVGFIFGRFAFPYTHPVGTLEVTQDAKSIFSLDIEIEPEELKTREQIVIKVTKKGPPVS